MKRRMIFGIIAGCFLTGCALTTQHDQERQVTDITFRVGVENYTIVHGTTSLPSNVKILIASDLLVRAVDATAGGGIVLGVWQGITAVHHWVWGK